MLLNRKIVDRFKKARDLIYNTENTCDKSPWLVFRHQGGGIVHDCRVDPEPHRFHAWWVKTFCTFAFRLRGVPYITAAAHQSLTPTPCCQLSPWIGMERKRRLFCHSKRRRTACKECPRPGFDTQNFVPTRNKFCPYSRRDKILPLRDNILSLRDKIFPYNFVPKGRNCPLGTKLSLRDKIVGTIFVPTRDKILSLCNEELNNVAPWWGRIFLEGVELEFFLLWVLGVYFI